MANPLQQQCCKGFFCIRCSPCGQCVFVTCPFSANNWRIVPLKYLIVSFISFFFINFVNGNNKKYMIKVKLYILSVLLLLVSCTGNKVIDEQITRADSLMETNSDSALVALGMLDSLRKNNPKMSKAQQMRFDVCMFW